MRYLTALQDLRVCNSEVADLSNDWDEMEWQGLRTLLSLQLSSLPKLASLPMGLQYVSSLQNLEISFSPSLKSQVQACWCICISSAGSELLLHLMYGKNFLTPFQTQKMVCLPDSKEVQFSNVLALSYNDLPFHLRPYFLYLRLFPKDYDILVRRLLHLWLAEGFVKQTPEMTPEDTMEIYLEELVKRSMIQISKQTRDGSPKTCCLHSAHQ
ncbi:putative disease resistance rpp13-like protein 3 [Quercus suber]|uniref:Disease resistance rpp13-like protein 3 n=1 Tax=Quercus suber TaxID=58331 RepID=A0AAW0L2B9_QUESU